MHRGVSRQNEREPFERRSKSRAAAVVRERARGASEAKPSSSACSVLLPGMVRRMGLDKPPLAFVVATSPLLSCQRPELSRSGANEWRLQSGGIPARLFIFALAFTTAENLARS